MIIRFMQNKSDCSHDGMCHVYIGSWSGLFGIKAISWNNIDVLEIGSLKFLKGAYFGDIQIIQNTFQYFAHNSCYLKLFCQFLQNLLLTWFHFNINMDK